MPRPPEPRRRAPGRSRGWLHWVWRPALVLLVAGALGWWMLTAEWWTRAERRPPKPEAPTPAAPAVVEAPRQWRPRKAVEPAPGCLPEAERRCVEGDSWWVDSCGVIYAEAEECGTRSCTAGVCETVDPPGCGGEPILGACDGDVAHGCDAGRPYRIDCGAQGKRCVTTEEGPICKTPSESDCNPIAERPRCDGDTLVACIEGERTAIDCRQYGASCGRPPGGAAAVCVRPPAPQMLAECEDPCACEPERREDEVCNGLDDDADGFIDENGCEPVDVVAFVVVDDSGQGSYAPEDVDEEIARLGRYLGRDDDYGLAVRLVDVVQLREPAWLELDGEELNDLVARGVMAGVREEFYVPLLLTDKVLYQGVPRPGLSTVPNGTCGGLRRDLGRQPPLGLVALAKRRWATTGAHELGHFLGLCHTHADHAAAVIDVDASASRPCGEVCSVDDDGLCDTPFDPGPEVCAVDAECGLTCRDGSGPDAGNIMGYYPECRDGFSQAQALLMRRSLALRRGWHRCIFGDGCPCDLVEGGCPEGMSCRRYEGTDGPYQRCALDGPALPGGVCEGSMQCSLGSVCIGQPDADSRCVRPCTDSTPACRCIEVDGVTHPICIDDLRRDDDE